MNIFKILLSGFFISTLLACSESREVRDANDVLSLTIATLGGKDAIMSVNSLLIEGTGSEALVGQMRNPDGESDSWTVNYAFFLYDFENQRIQASYTRTAEFQWPLPRVNQQFYGVDGELAYTRAPNGQLQRLSARDTVQSRQLLRHHPLVLIRLAMDPAALVDNLQEQNGIYQIDLRTADGDLFTIGIDTISKLPVSVQSLTYHPNLGDSMVVSRFTEYEDIEGLHLPTQINSTIDRFQRSSLTVSSQNLNADKVSEFAIDPALSTAPVPPDMPAANVISETLGNGLWRLSGAGHHSILVEFSDHLTLIEAPASEQRTLAVIAEARTLVPDKPLTQLVVTHHHFDHTAGLRAAVSEGLTLITHRDNAELFRELVNREHTLYPDALARNPVPLRLMLVSDELILSDDNNEMRLYHIAGNEHASTLLMAYFPAEQILVQADVFGSGYVSFPYTPNLAENIEARELSVERHVPIHGTPLSRQDFERVLTENP